MSRRHIAKMLRRMAEIKERRARSEVLKAQAFLFNKERARVDWIDAQVEREAAFVEETDVLTGAILGMLNETRGVSNKRIASMDAEIENINGVLLSRREEHQAKLHRLNGATKVEGHVRVEHFIDMENRHAVELEDSACANRHSQEHEPDDELRA